MIVFVYRNLNRRGWCWSIKALDGPYRNLVVGHASGVLIDNPVFVVSEKGRLRVLRDLKKNVHAGIVGEVVDTFKFTPKDNRTGNVPETGRGWSLQDVDATFDDVTYNPYKYKTFVKRMGGVPISTAKQASIWYSEVKALAPN